MGKSYDDTVSWPKLLTREELYEVMFNSNTKDYNSLKAAEECMELALALQQQVLKTSVKVSDREIIDEIGDVKIRIKVLEKMYSRKEIRKRVELKTNKFISWAMSGKHKNI